MYTVKFYKGDYFTRQQDANTDRAAAYIEHHFNSSSSDQANYAVVVVGSNASETSRNWGRWYARTITDQFGTRVGGDQGLLVGGWDGRGDGNVKYTNMPAVLLEPLFASNPQQADIIRSESGQATLARILVESVRRFIPNGGLIAFSVGHKYTTSNPNDRGCRSYGSWFGSRLRREGSREGSRTPNPWSPPASAPRTLRVMQGERVPFETPVDEDAVVVWSSDRNLLFIPK